MKRVVVLIISVGVLILLISTKGLTTSTKGPCTKYQSAMYQGTMYQGAMYQVGRDNGTGVSLSSAVGGSSLGRYTGGMQASYYGGADAALHGSTNGMKQGALGVSPLMLSSDVSVKSYVSGGGAGASSAVSQHSGSVAAVGTGGGSAFSATAYTVPVAALAVGGGVTIAEEEAGRAKRGALGGGTGGFRPGYDREDPYDTPIGDLPAVLILVFAIGYAIVKRKKTGGNSTKDRCTMLRQCNCRAMDGVAMSAMP